jgi:AcrR family transcriptional regulator
MDPLADRRTEERDRRRGEILDAALRVAGETGVEQLTMEQVARAARLSRGLLYLYFRDRDDLHLGLCERGLNLFRDQAALAMAAEPRGLGQLIAVGRAYVAVASDCPVYFEALSRFQASAGAAADADSNLPACLAASGRIFELINAAIERGIRDGSVAADVGEPNAVAISLWAQLQGAIQIAQLKPGVLEAQGVTPAALIEQAVRMATVALAARGPEPRQ